MEAHCYLARRKKSQWLRFQQQTSVLSCLHFVDASLAALLSVRLFCRQIKSILKHEGKKSEKKKEHKHKSHHHDKEKHKHKSHHHDKEKHKHKHHDKEKHKSSHHDKEKHKHGSSILDKLESSMRQEGTLESRLLSEPVDKEIDGDVFHINDKSKVQDGQTITPPKKKLPRARGQSGTVQAQHN